MRWMLAMDTCGAAGGVALVDLAPVQRAFHGEAREQDDAREDEAHKLNFCVASARSLPGRVTQERLMLSIGEVLAAEGLTPSDLDVLGVVLGPGSFTGVRIGLAAAKGLAEALSVPVVAISRLAVLASAADAGDAVAEVWIDAGRGDVFVGRYAGAVSLGEVMLTGADALARHVLSEPLVVMEEALAARTPMARLVPAVGVREAVPLLVAKVRVAAFEESALIDANYLRVPDAELARLRALSTV